MIMIIVALLLLLTTMFLTTMFLTYLLWLGYVEVKKLKSVKEDIQYLQNILKVQKNTDDSTDERMKHI